MARDLSITYGSITMGEAPYIVNGQHTTVETNDSVEYSWEVVCVGDDEADFATKCRAIESAFATRFQTLTITWGSEDHGSFTHSSNTGFNHIPRIEKVSDVGSTGRSRVYQCSVLVELPASDNNGRRSSTVTVSEDASRIRTLVITGEYTAQGGSDARANAEAKLPAYATAIRTDLGGTWDKPIITISSDDQDKVASFEWNQREIVYSETGDGLDTAKIIRPEINYRRSGSWPGDSPGKSVRRRQVVDLQFSCGIDKDVTTDINAEYESTVQPYILLEAQRIFSTSQVGIVSESPTINAAANRIDVSMTLDVTIEGASVYSYSVVQSHTLSPGNIYVPRWDGQEWTEYEYETKSSATRVTVVTEVRDGAVDLAPVAGLGEVSGNAESGRPTIPASRGNWRLIDQEQSKEPILRGDDNGPGQIAYTIIRTTILERYVEDPDGTSGPAVTGGGF